jgi:ABC-type phosphate/phosphonate transport system substrate-binding protein
MMARPFVAPPDLPPDRAQALRAAFIATHKDPQYLEEAAKLIDGADVLRTIERIAGAPPGVVDHLKRLLAASKGGG